MPPPLDLARIAEVPWIDQIHYEVQVDSTNTQAHRRVQKLGPSLDLSLGGALRNELFICEAQTAGRGRGGNQWWATEGSLAFSVLTKPLGLPADRLPQVSLAVGVALCQALDPLLPGLPIQVKWPNDVYVSGRKIAGVLIEAPAAAAGRLIVGIGLNVNNRVAQAPPDLQDKLTSLCDSRRDATGVAFDRTAVLVTLLENLEQTLARLVAGDDSLAESWRERSLLTGRQLTIETPQQVLSGTCQTIADDGALVLATPSGVQHCYGGVITTFG